MTQKSRDKFKTYPEGSEPLKSGHIGQCIQ